MMRSILFVGVVAVLTNIVYASPLVNTHEDVVPPKQEDNTNGSVRQFCPQFEDIPITSEKGDTFMGARVYSHPGHDLPELACNGPFEDIPSGTHRPTYNCTYPDDDYCIYYPDHGGLGTLFIHPGCRLIRFYEQNYEGEYKVYTGPLFEPHGDGYDSDREWYESLIVDCQQRMPTCSPSDTWATVGYFDNTQSPLTSTYTYSYSIGTSWSSEMTNGFSVSRSVEAAMTTSYFKLFEASLSISATTGYDWSRTSSEAKNKQTSHSVSTEVPGGNVIEIQQAKGTCGGSDVETEMFRSVVTRQNGLKTIKIFTH